MEKIALLIPSTEELLDDNYLRFSNALLARGIEVNLCLVDSLALAGTNVIAQGFIPSTALQADDPMPALKPIALAEIPVIWLLSLGYRASFLDKMQLLYAIDHKVRIINSLNAIMHLKSKYFLSSKPELFNYPQTHASSNPNELYKILSRGGRWIAKPPAGSLGREVYLLTKDDPNARVILDSLCGPEMDQYALLQAYVPEIEQGEKRVLFAHGKPVGQYRRIAQLDHRTNMMQGARGEACDLNPDERAYCEKLGEFLRHYGAEFVGLDLAYPWIIEFNVINPGGLLTIEALSGENLTQSIINEILFSASAS